jgi:hypothetical protein
MGIRKSMGKNKKSKKPATAIAATRDEVVRKVALDRSKPRPRGMRAPPRVSEPPSPGLQRPSCGGCAPA